MFLLTDKKNNQYINIINDDRYKLMLGYTSYFYQNIKKYKDAIEAFKNKEKVYKVLNPYNFEIVNQTDEKVNDIKKAINDKYNMIYSSQKYYQIIEVLLKFVKSGILTDDKEIKEISKKLKIKEGEDILFIDKTDINISLNKLKKNGMLIMKIRSILTNDILIFINSLCDCFNEVSIYKPKITNIWLGNKYLICKGYKGNYKLNNNVNIGIMNYLIEINNNLITEQTLNINKVVEYINKKNYFSDEYLEYFENQKKAHKKWIEEFLKN